MKWHSKDESPNAFYDVIVKEKALGCESYVYYTKQIDYNNAKMRGDWMYAHDLPAIEGEVYVAQQELVILKDLLRTLLYELNAEASTSEDYATRKKAELLCEMIKLKLYGGKNDKKD